jgi:hypothetical protein
MPDPRQENDTNPDGDADRPAKEQDLHATEDSIRSDLGRLETLEATKTSLDPADPEVDRLSDEAVTMAEGLVRKTRAERELGQDLT